YLHEDVNNQSSFNTENGTFFTSTPNEIAKDVKKHHKEFIDEKERIAKEKAEKEEREEKEKKSQELADEFLQETSPLFIGDSLLVNIGSQIQSRIPNAVINGEVGRQMYEAVDLAKNKYQHFNNKDENIILELGINGDFTKEQLIKFIKVFKEVTIYLVTTHVRRDWQNSVNKKMNAAEKEYENVIVINWYNASEGHVEYFEPDGIHLNHDGVESMVDLIVRDIVYNQNF